MVRRRCGGRVVSRLRGVRTSRLYTWETDHKYPLPRDGGKHFGRGISGKPTGHNESGYVPWPWTKEISSVYESLGGNVDAEVA